MERLDTVDRGYRLRLVAADTILSLESKMKLPQWLLCMLKEGIQTQSGLDYANSGTDQAAVLRLFVKYCLWYEAVEYVLELIDHWYKANPIDRKKTASVWFPYAAVDSLLEKMDDCNVAPEVKALSERLSGAMDDHLRRIGTDSADYKYMIAAQVARN
mgnify:CR=1 FL=1